jgi:hypothetical protein
MQLGFPHCVPVKKKHITICSQLGGDRTINHVTHE